MRAPARKEKKMNTLKHLAVAAACLATLGAHAQDSATPETMPVAMAPEADGFDMLSMSDATTAQAAPQEEKKEGYEIPRIGVHIGSHHWPSTSAKKLKFNNENPGLYVRWKSGITAGFYRNSDFRNSVYGGWTWAGSDCGPALTLGVITGYNKGTIPLLVPSMCVLGHLRVMFIPRVEPKGAAVLHIAAEF
jgi:hypothetical protein